MKKIILFLIFVFVAVSLIAQNQDSTFRIGRINTEFVDQEPTITVKKSPFSPVFTFIFRDRGDNSGFKRLNGEDVSSQESKVVIKKTTPLDWDIYLNVTDNKDQYKSIEIESVLKFFGSETVGVGHSSMYEYGYFSNYIGKDPYSFASQYDINFNSSFYSKREELGLLYEGLDVATKNRYQVSIFKEKKYFKEGKGISSKISYGIDLKSYFGDYHDFLFFGAGISSFDYLMKGYYASTDYRDYSSSFSEKYLFQSVQKTYHLDGYQYPLVIGYQRHLNRYEGRPKGLFMWDISLSPTFISLNKKMVNEENDVYMGASTSIDSTSSGVSVKVVYKEKKNIKESNASKFFLGGIGLKTGLTYMYGRDLEISLHGELNGISFKVNNSTWFGTQSVAFSVKYKLWWLNRKV